MLNSGAPLSGDLSVEAEERAGGVTRVHCEHLERRNALRIASSLGDRVSSSVTDIGIGFKAVCGSYGARG